MCVCVYYGLVYNNILHCMTMSLRGGTLTSCLVFRSHDVLELRSHVGRQQGGLCELRRRQLLRQLRRAASISRLLTIARARVLLVS